MDNYNHIHPPIFPHVEVVRRMDHTITFVTYVRLKHRGKYYLHYISENGVIGVEEDFANTLVTFNHKVYTTIMFGKVDLKAQSGNGVEPFPLDTNQDSEEDRLFPHMKPSKDEDKD